MRIVILLLGLLFLNACDDAFASRGRNRARRATTVKSSAVAEVDSLAGGFSDWLFYFDGTNFADPWTNVGGSDSLSLDDDGETSPVGDQATTGLTNIGSRVGKAVDFNATDCMRETQSSGVNAIGPDLHIRLVMYPDVLASSDWISDYASDANNEYRIYGHTTNGLRFRISNGVNENYDTSVTGLTTGQWMIVDIVHDANGGGTGKALTTIYINGTEYTFSEAVNTGVGIASGGNLSIGDWADCGDLNFDGRILFYGLRNNISGIDETQHDSDCLSIGICS